MTWKLASRPWPVGCNAICALAMHKLSKRTQRKRLSRSAEPVSRCRRIRNASAEPASARSRETSSGCSDAAELYREYAGLDHAPVVLNALGTGRVEEHFDMGMHGDEGHYGKGKPVDPLTYVVLVRIQPPPPTGPTEGLNFHLLPAGLFRSAHRWNPFRRIEVTTHCSDRLSPTA